MKIAITGKGGVGKTTISSTLACILSENHDVFAIDADPDMNLASSLGITEKIEPISSMRDLIRERTGADSGSSFGEVFKINPKITDLPEKLSFDYKKDGSLKIMVMGTVEKGGDGCVCPAAVLLKALLRNIVVKKEEIVILDMEAGIEHLGRKTAESVDAMIVVVEPGLKSIETAERIKKLATDIGIKKVLAILNKCSSSEQKDFVEKNLLKINIELIGAIPMDNDVVMSDMEGKALMSYKNSNALKSIKKIASELEILLG
ncbi:MAG: AAA family ATPase [Methanobrevibacter arboriphilus]|jgi:CO dehydrogenase maturation factor|uniref:AAA family ATPase n=2 Tax=Methanobrevibacter arboriphilus TaxID=39441 RepID=A0A843AP82_METAZ|nr:AAA family ATPase [Methanobrevibacter arboriphilus]MBF4469059.1 AAA family ATPase [Methanobrevibacter arboriphilus]MCC7561690.1 AAA family ATPase [Methanobrevibacter arboriphilus]BBL62536.1 carbon monoxide dehydrogenase [Methanobrevibacter arboriphilus]GLI11678.1 carbon monoxide dehydrogenase [Methanobrevibacter arboriphilus]